MATWRKLCTGMCRRSSLRPLHACANLYLLARFFCSRDSSSARLWPPVPGFLTPPQLTRGLVIPSYVRFFSGPCTWAVYDGDMEINPLMEYL